MKLFDTFLARIAPYDCIVCGQEGALVCHSCVPALGVKVPSRCFRCMKLTTDFKVCTPCRSTLAIESVGMCYAYDGYVKKLVKSFKFEGKRAAAQQIARCLHATFPVDPNAVLVHIPTTTSHIRERGYDHAKLLARALAARTGNLHLPLLARATQQRQLGAGRQERLKNLADSFRLSGSAAAVKGAHIILIDDVVTTGATLSEAAKILKAAGAARIDALVFAQTIL